ncbi:MAG TPA: ectonucleotide pyrophosphatase/phosphodiesterase [Prosthecobacter sp.]
MFLRRSSFLLFSLTALLSPALQAEPAKDQHVILISVDGLAHYYFEDPKAPMPTIRKLAAEGARARRMKTSLPTVTWPNHTTLVTGVQPGKHGVIGNSVFDRVTQKEIVYLPDPHFDKDEIVKVPTVYDVVHQAGLSTAGIIWPASRNAKTLDWTVPDVGTQELFTKYGTPSLLEECRAAGIPVDRQEEWCKAGNAGKFPRDSLYKQMAVHVIKKHKPNFLALHLVSVDAFEHATGSKTPETYAAIQDSDNHIRDIVAAVEEAGIKDKTTIIVTADHGFITYTKVIQPNVLLKQAGYIKAFGPRPTERKVWSFSQGVAYIYVIDQPNKEKILQDITPKLAAMEGVEEVIEEKDFGKYGMLSPDQDSRMPDLILSAKDGYYFSNNVAGEELIANTDSPKGAHGYSPAHPLMDASFVIAGPGIKQGVVLDLMSNTDVAPTAAHLLGVEMKDVDGKVLTEVMK